MSKFKLTYKDPELLELIKKSDPKTLARWAIDCTQRVMHFFEDEHPNDARPKAALETLENWIKTSEFKMKTIRTASLSSHAVAKELGNNNPASSVSHSAGQAVATAHVPIHALGASLYALQAIHRASEEGVADNNVKKERAWQYKRLLSLNMKKK